MATNLNADIAKYPCVEAVASLLVAKGHPELTLFDLRDDLNLCVEVVEDLIFNYGEHVKLTDETGKPVSLQRPVGRNPKHA